MVALKKTGFLVNLAKDLTDVLKENPAFSDLISYLYKKNTYLCF